jgi:flagellar hook-associated protein 2
LPLYLLEDSCEAKIMASISSVGIGSGVLTSSLIDKLVNAEQAPTTKRLDTKAADINAQLSAFALVQSAVTDLRLPARALADPTAFNSLTASSTNSAISPTVGSGAKTGSYSVEVSSLAQANSLASAQFADSNTTTLGTGTLTIKSGSTSASITIDNSNNTLDGIASAINGQANLGVNASVLNTGSGYKLVLTATQSGVNNAIDISVVDGDGTNTDTTGLSQLSYTTGAQNLTQTQAAKDAALTVNGVSITRSSNTISDAINGVTLNLSSTNVGSPATVTVAQDTSSTVKHVQDFVDKYNALQQVIKDNTKFDASGTTKNGILLGDTSTQTVFSQIRNILGSTIKGLETASDRSLSDVGITTDVNTGKLTFNTATFTQQLQAHPQDVAAIFSTQGRTSDPLISYGGSSVNTKPGTYDINVSQVATRGTLTGSVALGASTTIDANNNNLTVKIDGTTSANLTLTSGTYTPAQLAAELQKQINNDSTLAAAGKSVTVSLDASSKLQIISNTYGSSSKAEITAVDTNSATQLGLSVAAGTTGVDVAGTINGKTATGSGQRLYAATGDASEGITVDVKGGTTGNRGTVTYIQGIGQQLVDLVSNFLGSDGTITAKNTRLNDELKSIATEKTDLQIRMDALRARLQKQFTAADLIVSKFKSTTSFLTSQFAAFAGTTVSSSGK